MGKLGKPVRRKAQTRSRRFNLSRSNVLAQVRQASHAHPALLDFSGLFAATAQKHAKTRANDTLGPLGTQNGLLRPARVPPVRSNGLFEPASAPLVRSKWPLWLAPEPPVRSERLIELAWAPPVRSKWPVWHAPVLVSVLKEAVRACFGAASALKEAFRACCSRSLFAKAGLGCTVL